LVAHDVLLFLLLIEIETCPENPLLRFAAAELFQQLNEILYALGRHMPELQLVQFAHGLIEGLKKLEALRSNVGLDNAAIVFLAFTANQAAFFYAIEQTGHVRVMADHAVTDGAAGEPCRLGATENAQNIVLRSGQARGFDELFGLLAEGVGGLEQSEEETLLGRGGGSRRFARNIHVRTIVV
jgi:hypothetical protein